MLRKRILKRLCVSVVTLAIINQAATYFHWYGIAWWFDMPMHFLGGMTVFYFSAIVWLPALKWVPIRRFIYESVITALLLGILWEALELFLYLHTGSPDFILLDSLSDMTFDLAGALFAAYLLVPMLSDMVPGYISSLSKQNSAMVS